MSMPSPVSVHYRRDLLGRIVAAGRDASNPKSYGAWRYNPDGTIAEEILAGGVVRSFLYDGLGRPIRLAEPAMTCDLTYRQAGDFGTKPYASGAISGERISYRADAFPAGQPAPQPLTTSYAYDAAGRLLAATASRADASLAASYDANGNLESLASGGAMQAYSYQGTNRLLAVTPAGGARRTFGHDANGAVTDAGGRALVRDPATGQLRRGSNGTGTVAVLRDARGWPALASAGTTKRLQLRDAVGAPLLELESTGGAAAPTLAHILGATGRAAMWVGGMLYALGRDARNSTGIVYGPDAKPAAWFGFRPYGTPDAAATSTNPLTAKIRWRYTGQEWNEALSLYDYGARLYDPAIARFLSPDPADQTPSPYMYVGGDPVDFVDPSGSVPLYLMRLFDRLFFLNENREIMGSVPYRSALGGLKDDITITTAFNDWEARKAALGDNTISNPLHIPSVNSHNPAQRRNQFKEWFTAVLEDGNVPNAMKNTFKLDVVNTFAVDLNSMGGNIEATWSFIGMNRHLTLPKLRKLPKYADRLTPSERYAVEKAYGDDYYFVANRNGTVALPKPRINWPPRGVPPITGGKIPSVAFAKTRGAVPVTPTATSVLPAATPAPPKATAKRGSGIPGFEDLQPAFKKRRQE